MVALALALPPGLAHASFPGQSGRIAFARSGNPPDAWGIYTVSPGSSNATRLTTQGTRPSWSPDGRRIAFEGPAEFSNQSQPRGIFVMRADGTQLRRLTDSRWDSCPSWAPGGRRIAYTTAVGNPPAGVPPASVRFEAYTIGVDGGSPKRLTNVGSRGRPSCPVWSPKGDKIAFTLTPSVSPGSPPGPAASPDVYVVGSGGGNVRKLTRSGGRDPDWSPDGTRIAFVREFARLLSSVYVMRADGSGAKEVPNTYEGGHNVEDVVWSPDGRRLLVFASLSSAGRIFSFFTINPDGSRKTREPIGGPIAGISWQPLDPVPPNTRITAGPAGATRSRAATFHFTSTEAASTFECKLDGGRWTLCRSPKTYRTLATGSHTFRVRAQDPAGNVDRTPAVRSWRVR
ncbi:MAG: hypothetical protein M3123_00370 [Actinomycetota bacterium]|nr:hypothetical protein [Actinomycetota bacterium]